MENLPDLKACPKLFKTKAICYLSKVINLLEESKCSADSDFIYDLVNRLSVAYFDYYDKFIDEVCDVYIEKNVLAILYKLLASLLTQKNDKTFAKICTFLVNFSSHSEKIASGFKEFKILDIIIDRYLAVDFSNLECCKADRLFKLYITIIHNYSCNPDNIVDYKEDEIKKTLLKIIETGCDDYFGIISMLILSFLIDENETDLLSNGANIVRKLLEKIKFTSNSPKRSDGFTLEELVHGLRRISINDKMKSKIDQENAIPILIGLLKTRSNEERVIESTLGTIEQLCFDDKVRYKLIKEYNIQKTVKPFIKSKCDKIRKICEGINWKIDISSGSFRSNNTEKSKDKQVVFDAFLSYSWANKDKIKVILENLKMNKIRVWFDEEQMAGSSIQAMADGIENSSLFIIATSTPYKNSANCRHEAEYAYHLKKEIIPLILEFRYKPSSWLGFIIGCKTYFEFSERRETNDVIQNLLKEIKINLLEGVKNYDDKETLPTKNKREYVKSENNSSSTVEKIKNWSEEDVLKWLDKNNLGSYQNKFRKINGSVIINMKEMSIKSPEYFNQSMEKNFEMNFFDVMSFNAALKFENL